MAAKGSGGFHDINIENETLREEQGLRNGSITFSSTEAGVLHALDSFRREGEGVFCDVVLEVNGRCFNAHRNILAANSRFFFNMFTSCMIESNERKVKLDSLNAGAVGKILDYFYSRRINIEQEDVEQVLDAANFLLVEPVKKACERVLIASIDSLDHSFINYLAEKYCLTELTKETATLNVIVGMSNIKSFIYDAANDFTWKLHIGHEPMFDIDDEIEVVILGSTIYGHNARNKLFKCNISNPKPRWEQVKLFPFDFRSCRYAALDGFLYVVYNFSRKEPKKGNPVRCYDTKADKWIALPHLKCTRDFFKVIATEDQVFVLGGFNRRDKAITNHSVEKYEPKEKKWSYAAQLQTPRLLPEAVCVHGKIYVAGGYETVEDWRSRHMINKCEVYTPSSDEWQMISPLPPSSVFESWGKLLFTDNKICALQCTSQGKSDSVDALEYNTEEDTWQEVTLFGQKDVSDFGLHSMQARRVCLSHLKPAATYRFFYSRITGDYITTPDEETGYSDWDN